MNSETRTVFYVRVDGVDIHAYDNRQEAERHAKSLSKDEVVGRGDHMAIVDGGIKRVNVVETKIIGHSDYPEMVNNKG